MTAETSVSGTSTLLHYTDEISPCEDLGLMACEAVTAVADGFSSLVNCCGGLFPKPTPNDPRSCCTTIRWGPDEVHYMGEEGDATSLAGKADSNTIQGANNDAACHKQQAHTITDEPEWENFDHFQVNQDTVEIWNEDTEEKQQMINAAFSTDFSDFSSFVNPAESIQGEVSIQSFNTTDVSVKANHDANGSVKPSSIMDAETSQSKSVENAINESTIIQQVKKKRACTCCGKTNKKDAPIKLKICSRCKTAYYCSAECQKVDWHYGHKDKCKAVVLL